MISGQKEPHPALGTRDINKPFNYNSNLFIYNLVTNQAQPLFEECQFLCRNAIKCCICTQKTRISIQKHHTGITQLLFPFSCFVGSYGNGAWSNVSPEYLQATSKQDRGWRNTELSQEQIGTSKRHQRTACSGKAWNQTKARMGRKELNGNEIPSDKTTSWLIKTLN